MTRTPGDIGMHDLRLFGRSVSASRTCEPELVTPPPPPLKSQGAGLSLGLEGAHRPGPVTEDSLMLRGALNW